MVWETTAPKTHDAAESLLADAFARRYRYPSGFPGFTARARFGPEARPAHATVAVCGPGEVAAVVDEPCASEAWLLQELRSLSRLCWGHDYEAGEGRFRKSLVDEPHPLGPLVVLHDDPHQATFRVHRGRVTLMTRRQGTLLETVRIERWHVRPDGRVLPARWVAELWDDAIATPLRTDRYWDLYKPLAGELLPMVRRVETSIGDERTTLVLSLSAWRVDGVPLDDPDADAEHDRA